MRKFFSQASVIVTLTLTILKVKRRETSLAMESPSTMTTYKSTGKSLIYESVLRAKL